MSLSFQEQKSLTRKDLYDIEGDDGKDTEKLVFDGTDDAASTGGPEATTEDNTTTVPATGGGD
jgi:hypothetical protein